MDEYVTFLQKDQFKYFSLLLKASGFKAMNYCCQKMYVRCLALNMTLYVFSVAILEMNKLKPSM